MTHAKPNVAVYSEEAAEVEFIAFSRNADGVMDDYTIHTLSDIHSLPEAITAIHDSDYRPVGKVSVDYENNHRLFTIRVE
ncbi:hypothetical protein PP301_gp058 [Gordonia phage GMA2]|uniref:Uncharacterized protein n=1 Tax=Gordonia phage GMA2 TaxID=1647283 RepID=A0A0K0N6V3_9CAUD|nr:hypothetical protein PP301_gp058 [Gordonia phage GMA2]AKJ72664.1 hypothetical protein GMA2_126 [Gordonia phage GMA2]